MSENIQNQDTRIVLSTGKSSQLTTSTVVLKYGEPVIIYDNSNNIVGVIVGDGETEARKLPIQKAPVLTNNEYHFDKEIVVDADGHSFNVAESLNKIKNQIGDRYTDPDKLNISKDVAGLYETIGAIPETFQTVGHGLNFLKESDKEILQKIVSSENSSQFDTRSVADQLGGNFITSGSVSDELKKLTDNLDAEIDYRGDQDDALLAKIESIDTTIGTGFGIQNSVSDVIGTLSNFNSRSVSDQIGDNFKNSGSVSEELETLSDRIYAVETNLGVSDPDKSVAAQIGNGFKENSITDVIGDVENFSERSVSDQIGNKYMSQELSISEDVTGLYNTIGPVPRDFLTVGGGLAYLKESDREITSKIVPLENPDLQDYISQFDDRSVAEQLGHKFIESGSVSDSVDSINTQIETINKKIVGNGSDIFNERSIAEQLGDGFSDSYNENTVTQSLNSLSKALSTETSSRTSKDTELSTNIAEIETKLGDGFNLKSVTDQIGDSFGRYPVTQNNKSISEVIGAATYFDSRSISQQIGNRYVTEGSISSDIGDLGNRLTLAESAIKKNKDDLSWEINLRSRIPYLNEGDGNLNLTVGSCCIFQFSHTAYKIGVGAYLQNGVTAYPEDGSRTQLYLRCQKISDNTISKAPIYNLFITNKSDLYDLTVSGTWICLGIISNTLILAARTQ